MKSIRLISLEKLRILFKNKYVSATIFFMFIFFIFNQYEIFGDGWRYLALLKSMFFLNDQFTDKFELTYIFFPILTSPFVILSNLINIIFHINLINSNIFVFSTVIASNVYSLGTLLLSIYILDKYFNLKYSFFIVIATFFGTTLFAYTCFIPSYNHATASFVCTIFILTVLRYINDNTNKNAVYMGIVFSLYSLIRIYNVLFLPIVLLFYIIRKEYKRTVYFAYGYASLAWLIPVLLFLDKTSLRDVSPGVTDIAGNYFAVTHFMPKYLFTVLFGGTYGLLIWTPLIIISFIGIAFLLRKNRTCINQAVLLLLSFFCVVLYLRSATDPYGGIVFGQRLFTEFFILFAIGYGVFVNNYFKLGKYLGYLCILITNFILFNWVLGTFPTGHYSKAYTGSILNLMCLWVTGDINIYTFIKRIINEVTIIRFL